MAATIRSACVGSTMALVHEAYIRLVDMKVAQHWDSRGHFFVAAAEAMRQSLSSRPAARPVQKPAGGISGWSCPRGCGDQGT